MPFFRFRSLALLVLVFAAGGAGFLYVIPATPVHAAPPPRDLDHLSVDHTPANVPAVAFSDAAGRRVALASLRGRYVLLNLWATWCAPCVKELPELARLKAALPQVEVVAVNVGRNNAAQTAAFLAAHGAGSLAAFVDSNAALLRAFSAQGLPLSVLVDRNGKEIARAVGPCDWGTPVAIAYLKSLMPARAPS
ncbi:MAG: TlpA disulfide reductase family protein [Rhizomicrobium sp.]|jgi:thiol-disulfide isomerase/thioredoxin